MTLATHYLSLGEISFRLMRFHAITECVSCIPHWHITIYELTSALIIWATRITMEMKLNLQDVTQLQMLWSIRYENLIIQKRKFNCYPFPFDLIEHKPAKQARCYILMKNLFLFFSKWLKNSAKEKQDTMH